MGQRILSQGRLVSVPSCEQRRRARRYYPRLFLPLARVSLISSQISSSMGEEFRNRIVPSPERNICARFYVRRIRPSTRIITREYEKRVPRMRALQTDRSLMNLDARWEKRIYRRSSAYRRVAFYFSAKAPPRDNRPTIDRPSLACGRDRAGVVKWFATGVLLSARSLMIAHVAHWAHLISPNQETELRPRVILRFAYYYIFNLIFF